MLLPSMLLCSSAACSIILYIPFAVWYKSIKIISADVKNTFSLCDIIYSTHKILNRLVCLPATLWLGYNIDDCVFILDYYNYDYVPMYLCIYIELNVIVCSNFWNTGE